MATSLLRQGVLLSETDPRVTYGVKELLARIDSKLEGIDNKLDAKADARELDLLAKRVDQQGERLTDLSNRFTNAENMRRDREKQSGLRLTNQEKIIGLCLAVAALLIQALTQLGAFH